MKKESSDTWKIALDTPERNITRVWKIILISHKCLHLACAYMLIGLESDGNHWQEIIKFTCQVMEQILNQVTGDAVHSHNNHDHPYQDVQHTSGHDDDGVSGRWDIAGEVAFILNYCLLKEISGKGMCSGTIPGLFRLEFWAWHGSSTAVLLLRNIWTLFMIHIL